MINKILAFLIFVLVSIFNQVNAQELEMKLLVEKNDYFEQEPITAILVLQNISSIEIDVREFGSEADGYSVRLIVENKEKEVFKLLNFYTGAEVAFIIPKFLESGNAINTFIFVSRCYGNNDTRTNNGFNVVLLTPNTKRTFLVEGTYKIYAEYRYRHGNVVKSNVIEINVQKPYSNEQIQVYSELKKAASEFDKGNSLEYHSILLNIIKNYPDNPYTRVAYTQIILAAVYKEFDNELIKRLINDYTTHFGNSYGTYLSIYTHLDRLKDNGLNVNVMDQMSNKEIYKYYEHLYKDLDK